MALTQFKKAKVSFEEALSYAKQQKREAAILDALQDMLNEAKSKL